METSANKNQQFTVDKEALKVDNATVARSLPRRNPRQSTLASPAAIPRPMGAPRISPVVKPFEADKPEPKSPTVLTADPLDTPDDELRELALEKAKAQEEDKDQDSKDREEDIYADAALQCSIENKDACVMCSG